MSLYWFVHCLFLFIYSVYIVFLLYDQNNLNVLHLHWLLHVQSTFIHQPFIFHPLVFILPKLSTYLYVFLQIGTFQNLIQLYSHFSLFPAIEYILPANFLFASAHLKTSPFLINTFFLQRQLSWSLEVNFRIFNLYCITESISWTLQTIWVLSWQHLYTNTPLILLQAFIHIH